MSSDHIVGPTPHDAPCSNAEVVPFYVCPGAREITMDYTVFPYGGVIAGMAACPARDICAWYAAHDLGATVEYNDQPAARLLPAAFKTGPFSCAHFRDYEKMIRESAKPKAKPVAPALVKDRSVAARAETASAENPTQAARR